MTVTVSFGTGGVYSEKAKGRRQNVEGKRQKAKGKRQTPAFYLLP
jgi:hypothetical protein